MFKLKRGHQGYYYTDTFRHSSCDITLNINVTNKDFTQIFNSTYNMLKITGKTHDFNMVIKSKSLSENDINKQLSLIIKGDIEPVIYSCSFSGAISRKASKKHKIHYKKLKHYKTAYTTSKWAIQHPYGGGKFTPK